MQLCNATAMASRPMRRVARCVSAMQLPYVAEQLISLLAIQCLRFVNAQVHPLRCCLLNVAYGKRVQHLDDCGYLPLLPKRPPSIPSGCPTGAVWVSLLAWDN